MLSCLCHVDCAASCSTPGIAICLETRYPSLPPGHLLRTLSLEPAPTHCESLVEFSMCVVGFVWTSCVVWTSEPCSSIVRSRTGRARQMLLDQTDHCWQDVCCRSICVVFRGVCFVIELLTMCLCVCAGVEGGWGGVVVCVRVCVCVCVWVCVRVRGLTFFAMWQGLVKQRDYRHRKRGV